MNEPERIFCYVSIIFMNCFGIRQVPDRCMATYYNDWPWHRQIHDVEYNASWSRRAVQMSYEAWLIGRDMDASKKVFCGNGEFSTWLWALHRCPEERKCACYITFCKISSYMPHNLKIVAHVSILTPFCLVLIPFFRLIRTPIATIDWILWERFGSTREKK